MWEKIAKILNGCKFPVFNVDKRGVRDHIGNIINRYQKKIRAEEKASGIAPDEPTELDELLEQIIALEESSEAELQDASAQKKAKLENDKAKAEDIRLKAMEKISDTKKRASEEGSEGSTRKRRSGADAIAYLSERAELNYELKEKELELKRQEQELGRRQLEASVGHQLQQQQQQTAMIKLLQDQQQQYQQQQLMLLQQQQQQTAALMGMLNSFLKK